MCPMRVADYAGRAVIVTGGTRGIGAGIARAFLEAGAQVLVCGRTEPSGATPLPSADGRVAVFTRADVRDPAQAQRLIGEAAGRFGRLDVVVSNAGGSPAAAAAAASPRLHAKVIELNLIAPLHVAQAANAVMQGQPGSGSIIMIGSVSGTRPSPGTAAYGAAKAGLHHLATSLAVEWAPKVRVNGVRPDGAAGPAGDPGRRGGCLPVPGLAARGRHQRRLTAAARRRRAARVIRAWPRRTGRCTLAATRTCSTKGLAMVASIKPYRDELGLSDGLMLIDGTWPAAQDGQTWDHSHPATGEQVASFPVAGPGDVDLAVRAARRAFDEGPWPRARAGERIRVLRRIADAVREHGDELLKLQALDNSVPLSFGSIYATSPAFVADVFDHHAGWADKLAGETLPPYQGGDHLVLTLREPVGVVGAVIPWNAPLLLFAQKAAPALAAGCTIVAKPSEYATFAVLRLAAL